VTTLLLNDINNNLKGQKKTTKNVIKINVSTHKRHEKRNFVDVARNLTLVGRHLLVVALLVLRGHGLERRLHRALRPPLASQLHHLRGREGRVLLANLLPLFHREDDVGRASLLRGVRVFLGLDLLGGGGPGGVRGLGRRGVVLHLLQVALLVGGGLLLVLGLVDDVLPAVADLPHHVGLGDRRVLLLNLPRD